MALITDRGCNFQSSTVEGVFGRNFALFGFVKANGSS